MFLEAIAASVGAGILLGGFVAATFRLIDRQGPDRLADASCIGGWVGLVLFLTDTLIG
jgi:hypothetical protein